MLLVLSLIFSLLPPRLSGAQQPDTAAFLTMLGRDTVALEKFQLTASRLDGDIVLRAPRTARYHYVVTLRADGSVARAVTDFIPLAGDNSAQRRTTITFGADSARVDLDSAGVVRTATYATARGTRPELMTGFNSDYGLYISLGMYQLIVKHFPERINDSVSVPVIGAINGRPARKLLVRRSATMVDVDYFGILWTHLIVNAAMQVQGADATGTTEKTRTTRVATVDIDAAAKEFARRDRSGASFGVSSPAASVRAQIGSATIAIDYSSPRKRGRTILGATVPYQNVWRTGANAATVLTVSRPITIGGFPLSAGQYTLWTLPTKGTVQLIVNAQHGQWGTDYDVSKDLVRLPMKSTKASVPVENFTIDLTHRGNSGELRLRWDDFIWSIPIAAR